MTRTPAHQDSATGHDNRSTLPDLMRKEPRLSAESLGSAPLQGGALAVLSRLVDAAHSVEAQLQEEFGIHDSFSKIKVLVPGPFNNALVNPNTGTLNVIVGRPSEYADFFAAPRCLYAHEVGHLLAAFDSTGRNRYAGLQGGPAMYKVDRELLNSRGNLPSKFFGEIPYNLLPHDLLFPDKYDSDGLLYFANELISEKVALQICGPQEAREYHERKVRRGCTDFENPFGLMQCHTLATKYDIHQDRLRLRERIDKNASRWANTISTSDLLGSMAQFFDSIELRHQLR
jgi:hypothetical protein